MMSSLKSFHVWKPRDNGPPYGATFKGNNIRVVFFLPVTQCIFKWQNTRSIFNLLRGWEFPEGMGSVLMEVSPFSHPYVTWIKQRTAGVSCQETSHEGN